MRLRIERDLPCSEATAFSLVSAPAAVRLWAPLWVESVSTGDGGHVSGTGALRRIHLRSSLRDVSALEVVEASEPSRLFASRILDAKGVTYHRAEFRISPRAVGCRLDMELELELQSAMTERLVGRLVRSRLDRGLSRLERAASIAAIEAPPPVRRFDDGTVLPGLFEEASRGRKDLLSLMEAAADGGAGGVYFVSLFEQWSDAVIDAARRERFRHPAWMLRVLIALHAFFVGNATRWLRRERKNVESHWRRAFSRMEERERHADLTTLETSITEGLRALFDDDLPRALAETWLAHYMGRADFVRLRADVALAAREVPAATLRMLNRVRHVRGARCRGLLPWQTSAVERALLAIPGTGIERALLAFDRGDRMADLVLRMKSPLLQA